MAVLEHTHATCALKHHQNTPHHGAYGDSSVWEPSDIHAVHEHRWGSQDTVLTWKFVIFRGPRAYGGMQVNL